MKARPYYFEVKDMVAQFIAAFDDIVIGRYNKNREEKDRINVRYLYAPKQRVMHDLINTNKTIDLPAVAVNIQSISRDTTRVFNKIDGFYYSGQNPQDSSLVSRHIKAPIPINLTLNVSILSRYQTDVDQILSNFVPFCNPYVVISWYLPKAFNVAVDQEIRSEVLWDGNVSLNYPTELVGTQKARVTADTTFTVKGWLFKDEADPTGNIFYIKKNFIAEDILTEYETMTGASLSGHYMDTLELSASPFVTDIYFNGNRLNEPLILDSEFETNDPRLVTLKGTSLQYTSGVLLSGTNLTALTSISTFEGFTRQGPISGQLLDFTIVDDNTLSFEIPRDAELAGRLTFVPFNTAGWDSSINSYLSATAPLSADARGVKPIYIEVFGGYYIEVDASNGLLSLSGSNNPLFFVNI